MYIPKYQSGQSTILKTTNDLSFCYSFQIKIGEWRYDQREFFDRHIRWIETKTAFFRQTYFFQPEIEFHDNAFEKRKFIILAKILFHDDDLEISHNIVPFKRFIPACNVHFFIVNQVFNDLPEHQVDLRFNSKAKTKLYTYDIVWNNVLNGVFCRIWVIQCVDMNNPINICTLWLF